MNPTGVLSKAAASDLAVLQYIVTSICLGVCLLSLRAITIAKTKLVKSLLSLKYDGY